jgi:tetratricopeptide (TPR) repeat protein
MLIFVSWSGRRSRQTAEILHSWIPLLPMAELATWVSGEAIDPGTRWNRELDTALEGTDFGVLCLTRSNQNGPWINFEAGALSGHLDRSRVIPYLLDFSPDELLYPLKQFQAVSADYEGTWKLVRSIYKMEARQSRTETQLEMAFQALWPTLEGKLALVGDDADDPSSDEVDDRDGLPNSTKRLTLLVESLSARILSWEERAFGTRDSLRESGFFAPEMRREIRQEMAELDRRISRLDLFDKVSELLRQADFRLEKQPDAALHLYEKAIELDRTSVAARVGLAKAYRELADMQRAISILDDIISEDPSAERAIYNRACYKNLSDEYSDEDALRDLSRAIELRPGYREYALIDTDFASLLNNPSFLRICEQP